MVTWLPTSEAARMLGIHPNTLKRIPPSELPYRRASTRGDRRYNLVDIRRYIEYTMVR